MTTALEPELSTYRWSSHDEADDLEFQRHPEPMLDWLAAHMS